MTEERGALAQDLQRANILGDTGKIMVMRSIIVQCKMFYIFHTIARPERAAWASLSEAYRDWDRYIVVATPEEVNSSEILHSFF